MADTTSPENKVAQTPLMAAVMQNNGDILKKYISMTGCIDPVNHMTALQIAAANGKAHAVNGIVKAQNQNASSLKIIQELGLQTGPYRRTALMHAAIANQGICIRPLAGEMGLKDSFGNTALILAVKNNSYIYVKDFCDNLKEGYLERSDAEKELGAYQNSMTALMHAAALGHCEILDLLLPYEACLCTNDVNRVSALMVTVIAMTRIMHCFGGTDQFNKLDLNDLLNCHPDDFTKLMPSYQSYKPFASAPEQTTEALASTILADITGQNPTSSTVMSPTAASTPGGFTSSSVISPNPITTTFLVGDPSSSTIAMQSVQSILSPRHQTPAPVTTYDKHPLHYVMNYISCMRQLMVKEVGMSSAHPTLSCALYCAVVANNLIAVKILSTFETQMTNSNKESSLILAARLHYPLIAKELLIRELGHLDVNGFTALMYAAVQGDLRITNTIVSSREMCIQTQKGYSALMLAVMSPLAMTYYKTAASSAGSAGSVATTKPGLCGTQEQPATVSTVDSPTPSLPVGTVITGKELETTGINTRTSNLDVVRLLSSPYLNRNRKQKYITSLQIPATVKEKILKQAPGGEGGLYSASGATALMYAVARGYTDYVCELKETECGLQATGELHDLFNEIEYSSDMSFCQEMLGGEGDNVFITPEDVWLHKYSSTNDATVNNEFANKKMTMKALRAKEVKDATLTAKNNYKNFATSMREQQKKVAKEIEAKTAQAIKNAEKIFTASALMEANSDASTMKSPISSAGHSRHASHNGGASDFRRVDSKVNFDAATSAVGSTLGINTSALAMRSRSFSNLQGFEPTFSGFDTLSKSGLGDTPANQEVSVKDLFFSIQNNLGKIKDMCLAAFQSDATISNEDQTKVKHIISTCMAYISAFIGTDTDASVSLGFSKQAIQKIIAIGDGCRSLQAKINSTPGMQTTLKGVEGIINETLTLLSKAKTTSAKIMLRTYSDTQPATQFQAFFSHIGFSALMLAAELNQYDCFMQLFEAEAGLVSSMGASGLLIACMLNRVKIMDEVVCGSYAIFKPQVLSELKARLKPMNATALMVAAASNNRQIIEILLYNKDTRNLLLRACDDEGNTALHYAVRANSVGACKLLAPEEFDIKNRKGLTPYEVACEVGSANCIDILSEYGETGKRMTHTPLMLAAINSSSATCEEIIKTSDNADLQRRKIAKEIKKSKIFKDSAFVVPNVESMLHETNLRVVKRLDMPGTSLPHPSSSSIVPGDDSAPSTMGPGSPSINVKSKFKRQIGKICECCKYTALMHAVEVDAVDVVRILAPYESRELYYMTLPEIKQEADYYTALMISIYRNQTDIARILIPYEAGMRSSNSGVTALLVAARMGRESIVAELAPLERRINDKFDDDCLIAAIKYLSQIGDTYVLGSQPIVSKKDDTEKPVGGTGGDLNLETDDLSIEKILADLKTKVDMKPVTEIPFTNTIIMHLANNIPSRAHTVLGLTHLQFATKLKVTRVVEVLVELGHGVRVYDDQHQTALMIAATNNYIDGVKLLAPHEKGMLNKHNDNARVLAMKQNYRGIEDILAQYEDFPEHKLHNAIVKDDIQGAQNNLEFLGCMHQGESCLMTAAMSGKIDMFNLLYNESVKRLNSPGQKQDLGLRDKRGYTCFMRLVERCSSLPASDTSIFTYLDFMKKLFTVRVELGVSLQQNVAQRTPGDKYLGMTAFLMACAMNCIGVVKLIMEAAGETGSSNKELFELEVKSRVEGGMNDYAFMVAVKNGSGDVFDYLVSSPTYVRYALPSSANILKILIDMDSVEQFKRTYPVLTGKFSDMYSDALVREYAKSVGKEGTFFDGIPVCDPTNRSSNICDSVPPVQAPSAKEQEADSILSP